MERTYFNSTFKVRAPKPQKARKSLKRSAFKRSTKPKVKNKPSKLPKPKIWSTDRADREFSLYIRNRDGKCLKCGRSDRQLTCSHFWSRRHSATRYDPENCITLCWLPCHKYQWETEKQGAYRDFMVNWLGPKKYDSLSLRAASTVQRSDAIVTLMSWLPN